MLAPAVVFTPTETLEFCFGVASLIDATHDKATAVFLAVGVRVEVRVNVGVGLGVAVCVAVGAVGDELFAAEVLAAPPHAARQSEMATTKAPPTHLRRIPLAPVERYRCSS